MFLFNEFNIFLTNFSCMLNILLILFFVLLIVISNENCSVRSAAKGIFMLFWLDHITVFCFEINELLRVCWDGLYSAVNVSHPRWRSIRAIAYELNVAILRTATVLLYCWWMNTNFATISHKYCSVFASGRSGGLLFVLSVSSTCVRVTVGLHAVTTGPPLVRWSGFIQNCVI